MGHKLGLKNEKQLQKTRTRLLHRIKLKFNTLRSCTKLAIIEVDQGAPIKKATLNRV